MLTNGTCWLQKAALCGRVVSQQCAATGAGMGGMRHLGMGGDAQWGVLSPISAVGMLCPKPLLSVPCLCQPGGCSLWWYFSCRIELGQCWLCRGLRKGGRDGMWGLTGEQGLQLHTWTWLPSLGDTSLSSLPFAKLPRGDAAGGAEQYVSLCCCGLRANSICRPTGQALKR